MIVKFLVEKCPGTVRCADPDGNLPLHLACMNGFPLSILRLLIQRYPGALSILNNSGVLPFHLLCIRRNGKMLVKLMLKKWFKGRSLPALKDNTPAFIYAQKHHADNGVMNLLLDRSPDLFKPWNGYKPKEN